MFVSTAQIIEFISDLLFPLALALGPLGAMMLFAASLFLFGALVVHKLLSRPVDRLYIELCPPESGMRRQGFRLGQDRVTQSERHCEYLDGRVFSRYYRKDGSLRRTEERYPDSHVVRLATAYAADGSTVTATEERSRADAVCRSTARRSDGSIEITCYWPGRAAVYLTLVEDPDGSVVYTRFHADGRVHSRGARPARQASA